MLTLNYSGKRALVIGGARGIGAEIVRVLASAGLDVAWTHLDCPADNAATEALKAELAAMGVKVMSQAVDCADEAATKAFVGAVRKGWGGVDYLAFCAGYTTPKSFLELDAAEWRRVTDINLTGAFIAVRSVIEDMKARKSGAIVLLGSAAIVAGGGGRADYVSAKAALEGLNRALTKEFAPEGIRCNLVHPSLIETDLLRQRYPDAAKRDEVAKSVPLGRLGRSRDIADAAAFLLSDNASYITGQSLFVDGGRTFCK